MSLEAIDALVEQRIAQAQREGQFEHLGSGPIPELGRDYREGWWLRRLVERERLHEVVRVPPSGDLRARLAVILAGGDEDAVRSGVDQLNEDLQRRAQVLGLRVPRIDVETVVARWRATRSAP